MDRKIWLGLFTSGLIMSIVFEYFALVAHLKLWAIIYGFISFLNICCIISLLDPTQTENYEIMTVDEHMKSRRG